MKKTKFLWVQPKVWCALVRMLQIHPVAQLTLGIMLTISVPQPSTCEAAVLRIPVPEIEGVYDTNNLQKSTLISVGSQFLRIDRISLELNGVMGSGTISTHLGDPPRPTVLSLLAQVDLAINLEDGTSVYSQVRGQLILDNSRSYFGSNPFFSKFPDVDWGPIFNSLLNSESQLTATLNLSQPFEPAIVTPSSARFDSATLIIEGIPIPGPASITVIGFLAGLAIVPRKRHARIRAQTIKKSIH